MQGSYTYTDVMNMYFYEFKEIQKFLIDDLNEEKKAREKQEKESKNHKSFKMPKLPSFRNKKW